MTYRTNTPPPPQADAEDTLDDLTRKAADAARKARRAHGRSLATQWATAGIHISLAISSALHREWLCVGVFTVTSFAMVAMAVWSTMSAEILGGSRGS